MRPALEPEFAYLFEKVSPHTRAAITSSFTFDERKESFEFEKKVLQSLSEVCEYYDNIILNIIEQNIDGRKLEDLISWYNSILKHVQGITLSNYASYIKDREFIAPSPGNKVNCELGIRYYRTFCGFYKRAHQEYNAERLIVPRSLKFIKKRETRTWVPYLVEFNCVEAIHA